MRIDIPTADGILDLHLFTPSGSGPWPAVIMYMDAFGIREQLIFPEINYDKVEKIHGMDITVVTSADRDDLAMALLREFGWPFRGESPSQAA